MEKILKNSWALFTGMGLIMIAHGFQVSLLGVRAVHESFSLTATGFMLSGYFVGYFFYEKIGVLIVPENTLNQYQIHFNQYGLLIILASGFLPIIPFKLFTIASGFFDLSLGIFIIGSIISRGLRFYLIAGLLWKFGKRVRNFIETNLNLLFFIFALILFFLYLLYRMF